MKTIKKTVLISVPSFNKNVPQSLVSQAFEMRLTFPLLQNSKKDDDYFEKLLNKILSGKGEEYKCFKEPEHYPLGCEKGPVHAHDDDIGNRKQISFKSLYWKDNIGDTQPLTISPEMVLRTIKVRLYPNKSQTKEINQILGAYRYVYNKLLWLKRKEYKENNICLGVNELSHYFHNVIRKDPKRPWLAHLNSHVLRQPILQIMDAYERFFENKSGFPKFKRKTDLYTAHFPKDTISSTNKFLSRKITLTRNLKNIKFRCSKEYFLRLQIFKDGIKSATLSRDKSGKFFLSILLEMPKYSLTKFKMTGRNVGIDLGIKDQLITSDGKIYENRRFSKKAEKKISRLHRQLSRKEKGSKNWVKNRVKLAKAYAKVTNQKDAYFHETINELLSKYDVVFMEDLYVAGMKQNHRVSKALNDPCLGRFRVLMIDKASIQGKRVVFIDRFFPSSKRCHRCGYIYKWLKLKDRVWTCPNCGKFHDRDMNSALNLKSEGERLLSVSVKEKEVRLLKRKVKKKKAEKTQGGSENSAKPDSVKSQ